MAGKQGDINSFNAVGAGKTMVIESGMISADGGSPGGQQKYSEGSTGGDAEFGNVRPGGAQHIKPAAESSDSGWARPGGSQQIKEG